MVVLVALEIWRGILFYFLLDIGHNFFSHKFLDSSFNRNVFAFWGSEVAAHWFSISFGPVYSRTVDQQRMEKYNVSFLHLKINLFSLKCLIFLDSKISFVDLSLCWIGMIIKTALVSLGENMKTSVFKSTVLESSPSSNNSISWPKWEICQVLMERMSRAFSHKGRLVDKHCVDWFDVVSTEALQVRH